MPLTKRQLDSAILGIANDLQPIVNEIETGIKTTQNHYGRYLSLLSLGGDSNGMRLVALALVAAGANKRGVADAMKIQGI